MSHPYYGGGFGGADGHQRSDSAASAQYASYYQAPAADAGQHYVPAAAVGVVRPSQPHLIHPYQPSQYHHQQQQHHEYYHSAAVGQPQQKLPHFAVAQAHVHSAPASRQHQQHDVGGGSSGHLTAAYQVPFHGQYQQRQRQQQQQQQHFPSSHHVPPPSLPSVTPVMRPRAAAAAAVSAPAMASSKPKLAADPTQLSASQLGAFYAKRVGVDTVHTAPGVAPRVLPGAVTGATVAPGYNSLRVAPQNRLDRPRQGFPPPPPPPPPANANSGRSNRHQAAQKKRARPGAKVSGEDGSFVSSLVPALDTPEQIAEWREQRRQRWPTSTRVSQKRQEQPPQSSAWASAAANGDQKRAGPPSRPCRSFAAGRCRFGDRCRFSHDAGASSHHSRKRKPDAQARRPPSLLEKLLAPDRDEELEVLLQCFKFLVDEHFFRPPTGSVSAPVEK